MKLKKLVLMIGTCVILGAGIKSCVVEYECMEYQEFSGAKGDKYECKEKGTL